MTDVVQIERQARKTERLGFALLLIITVAVVTALGFVIYTAVKAQEATTRNRELIRQVQDEARLTRAVEEDALAQIASLRQVVDQLAAREGISPVPPPARRTAPDPTVRPRSTPRTTPRATPRATPNPPVPTPRPTPPPTPCPLPVCLP